MSCPLVRGRRTPSTLNLGGKANGSRVTLGATGSRPSGLHATMLMESGSCAEEEREILSLFGESRHVSGQVDCSGQESHRTFLEVVLNGPVDQKPAKSETDEVVLKEVCVAREEILQSQLAKARAAATALGDHPAFAKQVADLQGEIARLEKKVAGGKTAGKSSIANRVEQKSLFIERENKRVEQLREDVETAQAALIARDADLADEKLELEKLKDELVVGKLSRERCGPGICL